jgi:hypothetical protein
VSLLEAEISARLTTLQMAEDALAYRQQRLSRPCPDCAPGRRCPDHAHDEGLAGRYQHACDQALSYALEGTDPADVSRVMPPGSDVPPTAGALGVLTLARLRELAADGPVETVLDGRPVMIELDGEGNIVEYPLP